MFKLFFDRGLVYVRYGLCDCVVNIIVTVANVCRRAIRNQGKLEQYLFIACCIGCENLMFMNLFPSSLLFCQGLYITKLEISLLNINIVASSSFFKRGSLLNVKDLVLIGLCAVCYWYADSTTQHLPHMLGKTWKHCFQVRPLHISNTLRS